MPGGTRQSAGHRGTGRHPDGHRRLRRRGEGGLPDLQVGEYAIVHVGFALQRLDEESARQTLELFAELGMLQEEFGDAWEMAATEAGVDPVEEVRK